MTCAGTLSFLVCEVSSILLKNAKILFLIILSIGAQMNRGISVLSSMVRLFSCISYPSWSASHLSRPYNAFAWVSPFLGIHLQLGYYPQIQ